MHVAGMGRASLCLRQCTLVAALKQGYTYEKEAS